MRMIAFLFLAAFAAGSVPAEPQRDHRRGDQSRAFEALREGRLLPADEIARRVSARLHGWRYIGFDFDSASAIYTLKFLRDGNVLWVEVDGRSGDIVRQLGQ